MYVRSGNYVHMIVPHYKHATESEQNLTMLVMSGTGW